MPIAYIALGANLGDRLQTMRQAVERLDDYGTVTGRSDVYETPPWGYLDQPRFFDAVIRLETTVPPTGLMSAMLGIERDLGRVRGIKYGPRTIDLDLLFYDDRTMRSEHLTLPHPRLHERAFVLVPLADLAPDLVHPELGQTVRELLAQLDDQESAVRVARAARTNGAYDWKETEA